MGGINSTVPLVTLNVSGLNAPNKSICAQLLSQVQLFATLWTVAHWGPLSIGFFRQEYWSGLPFPSPGDLPHPGIKSESPASPARQVDSLLLSHHGEKKSGYGWHKPSYLEIALQEVMLTARIFVSEML